jgi:hypothetical protein
MDKSVATTTNPGNTFIHMARQSYRHHGVPLPWPSTRSARAPSAHATLGVPPLAYRRTFRAAKDGDREPAGPPNDLTARSTG